MMSANSKYDIAKGLCHMVLQQVQIVMGDVELDRYEQATAAAKEICALSEALVVEIEKLK